MIREMYSVYDLKSKIYSPPFYSLNVGTALRTFGQMCRDPQSMLSIVPVDFKLFKVGTFDDVSGVVTPQNPLMFVVDANAVIGEKEGNNAKSVEKKDNEGF